MRNIKKLNEAIAKRKAEEETRRIAWLKELEENMIAGETRQHFTTRLLATTNWFFDSAKLYIAENPSTTGFEDVMDVCAVEELDDAEYTDDPQYAVDHGLHGLHNLY